jgi:hypothetical protein
VDNFEQQILFANFKPPMAQISKRRAQGIQALPKDLPKYRVVRKERRRSSMSAFRQSGVIEIHIPAKMSKRQELEIIPEMIAMVLRREGRSRKTQVQLLEIGMELLATYLPDFDEAPAGINWRNMSKRWGY